MKIQEIYDYIDEFAPFESALSFDNVGILVGNGNDDVRKILLSLDITNDAVEYAHKIGADLIISHHPVIFDPIKNLDKSNPVYSLARYGIAALCVHTNLDVSPEGVNRALADTVCLINTEKWNIGLIGETDETNAVDFAKFVKEKLSAEKISIVDSGKNVRRVAVMSGAGGSDIESALSAGADTLLTGEVKYSQYSEAKNCGLNIIAAGHFETENIIIKVLESKLKENFYTKIETFLYKSKPYFDI